MATIRQIGSIAFVVGLFTVLFAGIPWYVTISDDPVIPLWFRIAVYSLLGGILIVLLTLALEQRKSRVSALDDAALNDKNSNVLLINSPVIPGREVSEVLGLVQGHTIFAIWLGKDLSAIARLILGGELTEYTEMMGRARKVAMNRMISQADELEADAVINVRYTTTSVVGSAAELLAYGTAVKLGK